MGTTLFKVKYVLYVLSLGAVPALEKKSPRTGCEVISFHK